jgi:hypothetical protein
VESELCALEISVGELKHLSGLDPAEVFRPSLLKTDRAKLHFLVQESIVSLALTPILVGFIYLFVIRPIFGQSVVLAIACILAAPVLIIGVRRIWRVQTTPKALASLLDEVDRYHGMLKAIDISDRLEAAGNPKKLSDRQAVLSALQLTRTDLVQALKLERILRENQDFIATNSELFANNLMALQALSVSDRASEYSQFLDEALQIGMNIQQKMKALQDRS